MLPSRSMISLGTLCLALVLPMIEFSPRARGAEPDSLEKRIGPIRDRLLREGLAHGQAYAMLTELCTQVGHRLSGSPEAERAVVWAERTMNRAGLDRVRREPVTVPRWIRGPVETAVYRAGGERSEAKSGAVGLSVCALGGSIGTPADGITAEVVEVLSFEELQAVGPRAAGKIIFFNRPFDAGLFDTFAAYGGAVGQRANGAIEAAKAGGVAALVRSMTGRLDDVPHTGSMYYADGVKQVPSAAVSTVGAARLSEALKHDPKLKLTLTLSCKTLPDATSANVLGELVGTEKPGEVIVIGGHLDSWDKGQGAHDDGAGCVHAIEALRLLKSLGVRPKRTIRAVMFMNEENGNRGGIAYAAAARPGETAIAAIESDRGGGMPHGLSAGGGPEVLKAVSSWRPIFEPLDLDRIRPGGGGVDIGPLTAKGTPGFEIIVDTQRYFDYHHSDNDVLAAVNERELELGAIAMALFSYTIAEEGLPAPTPASSRP